MALKTYIDTALNASVWRMQIDETTDTLFAEIRDTENKQVTFTGINLENGNVNFKNLALQERWLTGIEAAYHGILLLHGFQSEILPIHKGLTGIDGQTGQVLWSDYNTVFESFTASGLAVADARIQPKIPFEIDIRTGLRKATNGRIVPVEIKSNIKLPEILPAEHLPPDLLVLQPYQNAVHYLSHNNFRIVSLHSFLKGALRQHLYVFDQKGELVFEDILNDEIQKLQPEAFMSYKNKLIWLKNRVKIKALTL